MVQHLLLLLLQLLLGWIAGVEGGLPAREVLRTQQVLWNLELLCLHPGPFLTSCDASCVILWGKRRCRGLGSPGRTALPQLVIICHCLSQPQLTCLHSSQVPHTLVS